MRKWAMRSIILVIGLLVLMQAVRPDRTNPASNPGEHIQAVLPVHPQVAATFSRACNDCHSNNTVWPWYSNVAPASWLVASDVNEGRQELNFSRWGAYKAERQQKLLGEICKEVVEGEMPGAAYSFAHPQARLSNADREAICTWTRTAGARFPAGNTEREGD